MSAFGTKKPGGDMAVQLGFPSIFSEVVAHRPQAYTNQRYADDSSDGGSGSESDDDSNQHPLPAGTHLQDKYHEQKLRDARAMAMAGVQARKNSDYRHTHSHANYFHIPKAVLSQRRFANPSLGNQADVYAARPNQFLSGGGNDLCSLRGGVLRTAEGQYFGMNLLRKRANQLDVIDRNKMAFIASQPTEEATAIEQGIPEQPGTKAMLELNALLQQIYDAVYSGADAVSRFALADMSQALRLLFRISSIANEEELGDLLATFTSLREAIPNLEREVNESEDAGGKKLYASVRTMIQLIRKGYLYVERMLGAVNRSPKDRKRLSATLAKQFTKFGKLSNLFPDDEKALADDAPEGVDGEDFDEEEDDGGGDEGEGEGPPGLVGDDNQEEEGVEEEAAPQPQHQEPFAEEAGQIAGLFDKEAELNYLRKIGVGYVRQYAKRLGVKDAIGKNKKALIAEVAALPQHARQIFAYPNPYAKPGTAAQSVIIGAPEEIKPGTVYLKTYRKAALEDRLAELQHLIGYGHARGGASRRPAPRVENSIFTRPGMSSEYTEQMDSLRRAGIPNAKYSRDERNVFAKKSGAYLGEPLPKGGEAVEEAESYKYPVLKEGGRKFTLAKLREAPAPMFGGNASTATFGDGLKARLNGGAPVGFADEGKSDAYNGVPYAGGKKKVESSNDIVSRNNAIAAQRRRAREAMERARKGRGGAHSKVMKYGSNQGEAKIHRYFGRESLPDTREGFVSLAETLRGQGHNIRVNSGSSLANIRQNFIRRLKL